MNNECRMLNIEGKLHYSRFGIHYSIFLFPNITNSRQPGLSPPYSAACIPHYSPWPQYRNPGGQ